jgi:hypothetical protein
MGHMPSVRPAAVLIMMVKTRTITTKLIKSNTTVNVYKPSILVLVFLINITVPKS